MRSRRVRIALRWMAVVAGLAAGSVALLALYGAALVDRAIAGSRTPGSPRVLSAPLVLRVGDAWSLGELRRSFEVRSIAVASSPAPGSVWCDGRRFGVAAALIAGGGADVIVEPTPAGLRFAASRGAPPGEIRIRPMVIGTAAIDDVVRWPVPLERISPHLLTAVVDIEDRDFLSHSGLSLRGMVRAAIEDLLAGGVRQGGSTITQQLAKILLLKPARTLPRKILEAWLATLIEYRYDKRTILETYLNRAYFGQDGGLQLQGVEVASHYHFGRPALELGPAEAALLAGLVAAPNRFDPFTHVDAARARRRLVLEAMVSLGHLSVEDARVCADAPLPPAPHRVRWPAAVHACEALLARRGPPGADVPSTIDPDVQRAVAEGCAAGLVEVERRFPHVRDLAAAGDPVQVAVVAIAPDGRVIGLQGSRAGLAGEFNRALAARRPVGSLAKPFIAAAAFAAGWTPDAAVDDAPIAVQVGSEIWRPEDSDGRYRGTVRVRDALALSLNVPMVRLGLAVGGAPVAATYRRVGFAVDPFRPAMLLGAFEATPADVARAYAVFVAGGRLPALRWLAGDELRSAAAVDPGAAAAVRSVLEEVPRRGTAAALAGQVEGPLAAKTGTTDERRDSWFVALRPGLIVVVWIGTDGNRETGLYGATGAMTVWRAIDARLPAVWRGGRFAS